MAQVSTQSLRKVSGLTDGLESEHHAIDGKDGNVEEE